MIPVCHDLRRYASKVLKGIATNGKGAMGWCHGFMLNPNWGSLFHVTHC